MINAVYMEFFKAFTMLLASSQTMTLPESREASKKFFSQGAVFEPVSKVQNISIPGPDHNQIPLRIFAPESSEALPIVVYFHGGGWAFGSIDQSEPFCRKLVNRARCIVVSVDYRLAPENPFPNGLHDCYAATQWAVANAASFGGNPEKLVVAGESAGGNLAAAVAMMSRDQAGPDIKYQLLLYPVTTSDLDENVYKVSADQYFMSFDAMRMFWGFYLSNPADGDNPYASLLKSNNLTNLSPAFIVTAEFDPLQKEGEAYATKLKQANVPTRYKCYQGAVHGFLNLPVKELPELNEALKDISEALQNAFAT